MNRLTLAVALASLALGFPAAAAAQSSVAVDADLAKRGQKVWQNTGCMICHSIGKGKQAGPDLLGVHERREWDWLVRFLKNTEQMLANDPIAMALLEEYKYTKMPQVRLVDSDIQAVLHYIARETAEARD